MMKILNILLLMCVSLPSFSAEWVVDADASPRLKYDDNELMRENKRGDFSLEVTPTILLSRSLEDSQSVLSFGYQVKRYNRLDQLDRQDPFANLKSSWSTDRSTYGLNIGYSKRESRSFAEEDTGDFSNTSTVTTKSINPSFNYSLSELDSLSMSFSYRETVRNDLNRTDTDSSSLSLAWQRQLSERLSAGLSGSYSETESESLISHTQNDSYLISLNSTYKYSELWDINGSLGWRYLESQSNPVIGITSSGTSNGETYKLSATRTDELSTLTMGISLALSPTTTGGVNEQNIYRVSYNRELSERLRGSFSASYREFRAPDNDNNKTTYTNVSPSLTWNFTEQLAVTLSYQYRVNEDTNSNSIESNAVFATVNYDWNGIRFSR